MKSIFVFWSVSARFYQLARREKLSLDRQWRASFTRLERRKPSTYQRNDRLSIKFAIFVRSHNEKSNESTRRIFDRRLFTQRTKFISLWIHAVSSSRFDSFLKLFVFFNSTNWDFFYKKISFRSKKIESKMASSRNASMKIELSLLFETKSSIFSSAEKADLSSFPVSVSYKLNSIRHTVYQAIRDFLCPRKNQEQAPISPFADFFTSLVSDLCRGSQRFLLFSVSTRRNLCENFDEFDFFSSNS